MMSGRRIWSNSWTTRCFSLQLFSLYILSPSRSQNELQTEISGSTASPSQASISSCLSDISTRMSLKHLYLYVLKAEFTLSSKPSPPPGLISWLASLSFQLHRRTPRRYHCQALPCLARHLPPSPAVGSLYSSRCMLFLHSFLHLPDQTTINTHFITLPVHFPPYAQRYFQNGKLSTFCKGT